MTGETLGPDELFERYADAMVRVGPDPGVEMTLAQAVKMEELLCPADKRVRQDPEERAKYMAAMLIRGGTRLPSDFQVMGIDGTE